MGSKEKQQRYDGYIEKPSPSAMVAGRRIPYHLEYVRRYGGVAGKDRENPVCEERMQNVGRAGQEAVVCMEDVRSDGQYDGE